ncbi:hypothetical protein Taro_047768 [Colocasia esculenta]|uniref:Receptor-like serine/threonine-protein kinase n=1 Tax=Colocasia esculenta TaxID=4460 RepID=A0A843WWB2_COLES|nr:hypothetical protein [Colocasia esculenta]
MAASTRQFTTLSVLLLSAVLLSSSPTLSGAVDTIRPGQSLSGNQTISSANGTFELGFFSPGNSSRSWYLCVRFKSIPRKTIVWVANREAPLSDPASSELRLSPDGVLVLLDQSKVPIWSSNSSSSTVFRRPKSTVAVLLETGNFVLRDGPAEASVLWQSFDQPGDTLLPGAKIGYNGTEGKSWKLVSWKNREDPSPGLYSLELDPSGAVQVLIQRNGTQTFWKSGEWNGQIFSLTPEMMALHEYGIDGFFSSNTTYFAYVDHEVGGLSTMWIDVSGRWMWQKWIESTQEWSVFSFMPRDPCEVYVGCGPFGTCSTHITPYCGCLPGFEPTSMADWSLGDTSGGCSRRTLLQCGSNSSAGGGQDGFLKLSNVRLPTSPVSLTASSAQECRQACSGDCSCTAYAYGSDCSVWKGGLQNVKQIADGDPPVTGPVGDLFLRVAASELPRPVKKKTTFLPALLGAVAGLILVVLLLVVSMLVWRCHRRRLMAKALATQGFLVPFRYRDLRSATKNFSEKLGKGGFGSVFKGTLPDASVVAVKKLEGLRQGDKQFRVEVAAMAAVQHVNILRLRGFCCEGAKQLLVFDYMPNGSLDAHLYPKSVENVLDWGRRFQIAVGTARGLAYLHEKCRECIIHCDVKPENILLDEAFQPKVADFGMAKLVGRDFSRVLTTMRGTLGYLAPEWISGVPITPKADVYSYGMMLFEIISGRRNSEEPQSGRPSFFPAWVVAEVNVADDVGGCALDDGTDAEELRRACRVACWCIQENEGERPSMGQVVQMLEGVVEVEMPPVPRLLENHVASGEQIVYFLEMSFVSSKASSSSTVVSTN